MTKTSTATTAKAPRNGIINITGKGRDAREAAFVAIAPQSMAEALSRDDLITTLRCALGSKPAKTILSAARGEFIIGKVAMKMTGDDNAAKLEAARDVVLHYASAPKDGVKPRKLRKGQTGRRSPAQQRAYQAAKQQFSQLLAEIGLSGAKTQAQANASKKRGATGKRSPTDSGESAKPEATPKAATRDVATQHIAQQSAALLAYCNKNAKVVPLAFSEAVTSFKSSINKAMNDEQERS